LVLERAISVVEDLNIGFEGAKIGIYAPIVILVLGVFSKQGIELLAMRESHWWREKWSTQKIGLQVRGIRTDKVKRGIQWDRWKIRVMGGVGRSMEIRILTSYRYHDDQGEEQNTMG
jgi:hypothetical protein